MSKSTNTPVKDLYEFINLMNKRGNIPLRVPPIGQNMPVIDVDNQKNTFTLISNDNSKCSLEHIEPLIKFCIQNTLFFKYFILLNEDIIVYFNRSHQKAFIESQIQIPHELYHQLDMSYFHEVSIKNHLMHNENNINNGHSSHAFKLSEKQQEAIKELQDIEMIRRVSVDTVDRLTKNKRQSIINSNISILSGPSKQGKKTVVSTLISTNHKYGIHDCEYKRNDVLNATLLRCPENRIYQWNTILKKQLCTGFNLIVHTVTSLTELHDVPFDDMKLSNNDHHIVIVSNEYMRKTRKQLVKDFDYPEEEIEQNCRSMNYLQSQLDDIVKTDSRIKEQEVTCYRIFSKHWYRIVFDDYQLDQCDHQLFQMIAVHRILITRIPLKYLRRQGVFTRRFSSMKLSNVEIDKFLQKVTIQIQNNHFDLLVQHIELEKENSVYDVCNQNVQNFTIEKAGHLYNVLKKQHDSLQLINKQPRKTLQLMNMQGFSYPEQDRTEKFLKSLKSLLCGSSVNCDICQTSACVFTQCKQLLCQKCFFGKHKCANAMNEVIETRVMQVINGANRLIKVSKSNDCKEHFRVLKGTYHQEKYKITDNSYVIVKDVLKQIKKGKKTLMIINWVYFDILKHALELFDVKIAVIDNDQMNNHDGLFEDHDLIMMNDTNASKLLFDIDLKKMNQLYLGYIEDHVLHNFIVNSMGRHNVQIISFNVSGHLCSLYDADRDPICDHYKFNSSLCECHLINDKGPVDQQDMYYGKNNKFKHSVQENVQDDDQLNYEQPEVYVYRGYSPIIRPQQEQPDEISVETSVETSDEESE